MDLSTVHQGVHKHKKRVGRGIGSGHGKTSSRGHKGQWASAGAKKPIVTFEGGQTQLFRRIPKRGFSHASWDRVYHVVNVGDIDAHFEDGAVVDQAALKAAGLAKKLTIRAHHFSKSALEKVQAKGGTAEVIPPPKKPKKNKMRQRPPKQTS